MIADAEAVTGQAASSARELGRLIDVARRRRSARPPPRRSSLDAGLERLPGDRRAGALDAGRAAPRRRARARRSPRSSRAGAPQLATALRRGARLPRRRRRRSSTRRRPDARADAPSCCEAGAPTIEADPTRVVTGPFDLAPAISNLLTRRARRRRDDRGALRRRLRGVGPGTLDKLGLGAVADEPGNQLGYPAELRRPQHVLRVSAVLNCAVLRRAGRAGLPARRARGRARRGEPATRGDGAAERRGGARRRARGRRAAPSRRRRPGAPAGPVDGAAAATPRLGDTLGAAAPSCPRSAGGAGRHRRTARQRARRATTARALLDFLLRA